MKLHYGCGMVEAPGWYNCDASATVGLQRLPVMGVFFRRFLKPLFPNGIHYGNIVTGLALAPGSCDAIYCSHVLEHLSLHDLRAALANTFTYLRPDGVFRLVLPDFEKLVEAYHADPSNAAVSNFLTYSFLGRAERPRGVTGWLREYLGSGHHLWMWDYKGMAAELESIGFRHLRRFQYGDATDPAFLEVESKSRIEGCLAIECRK